ncbi:MAG: 3-oxoacyl-[acyl-carrier-protein] synthase III C-terminal domain-containing protein [Hyphomicrobiales bacterium]
MGIAAARMALQAAGLGAEDMGLILSACAVAEQPIPAMAPLIKDGLGLRCSSTFAFDVNASCLSFVAACEVASLYLASGQAEHVLVVSSEIASRALPWQDDVDTAAMFGDGAAAAVISRGSGEARLVASHMETWSEGYRDCELPAGGTRLDYHAAPAAFAAGATFRMDGRAAYKLAAQVIGPFMKTLLSKAGWQLDEVDVVVPHQASRGALDHLVNRLGIAPAKIVDLIRDHGNQIAASIPMALHQARLEGRLGKGKKVLLVGTSAGFSIGGLCLVT